MFETINIAISERNFIEDEIRLIKQEIETVDHDFPLPEICRQALLIRLGVLKNSLRYLERLVISELDALPLPDLNHTPKAKNNE